jgi:threonine-phosphate decarboxylase
MDPANLGSVDCVHHGGTDERDLLEFSANTNPDVPPGTQAVYENAFDRARRYPDDDYPDFRAAAADTLGVDPAGIVPTPGGLAAIRLAIATTVEAGDEVLVPAPSFGEYAREVKLQGGEPTFVAHDRILDADPADATLAIVCNPNNPTGTAYDHDALSEFAGRCRESGTALLVDEAFLGFTDRPSMAGVEGVVVARSLTKLYGLPGIRAGYAVATGNLLDRLETGRRAWSLSTPAAAVGAHCLDSEAFVARTRERVANERRRMREVLDERFEVVPSDAPFLLLDVSEGSVEAVVESAREGGIAIRDATTFRGLDSHVRIAVRAPAANDRLLEVLGDV